MPSKYAGYMGKVMMIDLTAETVSEYPWSDEQRERYLGGKIMAARILADHLTGKETAFSEENWVIISTAAAMFVGFGRHIGLYTGNDRHHSSSFASSLSKQSALHDSMWPLFRASAICFTVNQSPVSLLASRQEMSSRLV